MENIDEQSSDSDENMYYYDQADRLDPYHHKTNTARITPTMVKVMAVFQQ